MQTGKKTIVVYQGEPGAFSEQAALAYFGNSCSVTARETFREVFNDVLKNNQFGIVPVENSLFGSVLQNFDLLQEFPLYIIGEIKLRIKMNLMALPNVPLKNIRHIYSHPQGLGQSDKFLRTLKNVALHQFYDTAGAAKMIAEEKRTDAAAIASEQAAHHYGLHILKKSIETDHRNFTRFVVLSKKVKIARGKTKTSLIFATKNKPGSLHQCLSIFAEAGINLLKIESRPLIGKPWEYLFFVDIQGNGTEKNCRNAIEELQSKTLYCKNLGSYAVGNVVS